MASRDEQPAESTVSASQTSDEAYNQWLVLRAQDGDAEALRELVDRWSGPLQRQAMRLTGRPDAAADATQEAWLVIVRSLRKLNDPACFRRWAYQIVSRKCADWVRRQQRMRATTEPLNEEPSTTDQQGSSRAETVDLEHELQQLSSQDRVLLAMHYADEMPLAEIAEAMDLPLGTVKSRLYHVRQRLKQSIEKKQTFPSSQGAKP